MDQLLGRRFLYTFGSIVLCGAALLAFVFHQRLAASREYAAEVRRSVESARLLRDSAVVFSTMTVRPGVTFSEALERLEIAPAQAQEIIQSTNGVFDLRHVRAGGEIEVGRSISGELQEVRYKIDGDQMLSVRARPGSRDSSFVAEVQTIPSHTEMVGVSGEISDSLFGAVEKAGEGPELALRLADIFAWDLDFYSDPRAGDTFRVQVEKKTSLDGKDRAYGRVLYAEYVNDGHPYRALLFHDAEGKPAYFSPDGQSLEKAFLRSPLKFSAAVTSGFSSSRFHPILHEARAHLGTDYGAPIGTPVQAIGAGHVVFAGFKGEDGNMVQVRHSNGYESMYMHLSHILVHAGDRVDAGDRIGLVGMTGLATGPHLHFSILDHGVYKNFEVLRRNLPSAEPVDRADMAEFTAVRETALAQFSSPSIDPRANARSATTTRVRLRTQTGEEKTPPVQPAALR